MANTIKILGAFGNKSPKGGMTCIQVSDNIVIDAGNILESLDKEAFKINHIFITHTHLDHIIDIPFLIDMSFDTRQQSLIIYGLDQNITYLKNHFFNGYIWPDFSSINLKNSKQKAIIFKQLKLNETINIDNYFFKPVKTTHTQSSCGYVITKDKDSLFFTSDTYICKNIWDEVNSNKSIKSIIIETSFPSRLEELAHLSKHLTPKLLKNELKNLKRDDVVVYLNHLKTEYIDEITAECKKYKLLLNNGHILSNGALIDINNPKNYKFYQFDLDAKKDKDINQLLEIGNDLTQQKDFNILMEKILVCAKQLSNADGGTLYLMSEDKKYLKFSVIQTDSLGIKMGGTNGKIQWDDLCLYQDKELNKKQVSVLCAIEGRLINIDDIYNEDQFNFEGTKAFDKKTGYKTKSMLVIPMKDYENNVVGVIQLLNKRDIYGNTIAFNKQDEKLISSMSSQAAISMTNTKLINDLENLLTAFIESIATAIEAKSKYTGRHIHRVEEIAISIATAINSAKDGVFKDISFTENELKELSISAWMHDIGKIVVPEYIMDKATKLETIYDKIGLIEAKFEILKKDTQIAFLKNKLTKDEFDKKIKEIDDNFEFIKSINNAEDTLNDEKLTRLKNISILSDDEFYNLSIRHGTLNKQERDVINNHVIVTYKMLKALPFPQKYKNVPLIAGSHHKKHKRDKNGRYGGYADEEIISKPLNIQSKILAIADIFEALTATDRPYKKPNSIDKAFKILLSMAENNELDSNIVKFFIENYSV
jgi:HD-GYP domain-containing protein (c-di-GMP phosphodiesterase class II)